MKSNIVRYGEEVSSGFIAFLFSAFAVLAVFTPTFQEANALLAWPALAGVILVPPLCLYMTYGRRSLLPLKTMGVCLLLALTWFVFNPMTWV